MRKPAELLIGALALVSAVEVAVAQSDRPWEGVYAGVNLGDVSSKSCQVWTVAGGGVGPSSDADLGNRVCASGGAFVGGVHVGENVQYEHFIWGFGGDLELESASTHKQTLSVTGTARPNGTYALSSRLAPTGYAIFTPRIGYAGRQWLPYLTAGPIATIGPRNSTVYYTPTGASKPTVSFSSGRNFSAAGWVVGGGAEWGLNGPWSITAEYLRATLGRSDLTTGTCNGSASACGTFSAISLNSAHGSFSPNILRVGINYWFGYWNP